MVVEAKELSNIKLCIAGKNNIAVDVLEYVLKHGLYDNTEVVVICNKTETGINTWQKSLRYYAELWSITEITLEQAYRINDMVFLSLEFDRIINPSLFSTRFLYNIHFSALPKYKGMYTSALPILRHEQETGVTFHKIDFGIDTGDIVDQIVFPIEFEDTSRDLYMKYIKYGTQLAIKEIKQIQKTGNDLPAVRQDSMKSTYFSRDEIDYTKPIEINLHDTALGIHDQVRAFFFPEYQIPQVFGKKIVKSRITGRKSLKKPGCLIHHTDEYLVVSTIDYDIELYFVK